MRILHPQITIVFILRLVHAEINEIYFFLMWLTVLELHKHSFPLTTPPFEESENIYLMTSLTSLEPLMVPPVF